MCFQFLESFQDSLVLLQILVGKVVRKAGARRGRGHDFLQCRQAVAAGVGKERYIDIPDEVREALFGIGRPTPLHRARRLVREQLDKQIGPVLMDAFPFAGRRCERMTNAVMQRLGLAG